MSLGKKLFIGGDPDCTTDTVDKFGDSSGIALYTLDYDASDESGNYDGTPTDVTFGVDGQINYGASFNGSSSIIKDVLGSGFTYASKTMTFSAWIFVEDASNDNMIIGDGLATSTGGWGISTGYGNAPNRSLAFSVASTAMGGVQQTYSSVSVSDNTWTHIAVSVDFSSITDSVKMYINGTEDTSLTDGISGTFVDNTTYNTAIGGTWTGSAGRLFEGKIDQVRIFNKALSTSEISSLYGETACVYTSTTDTVNYQGTNLAYYKFDNTTEDETGNHDGTGYNLSYTFGRFGQCADFNGLTSSSGTYISVPHNTSFSWKNNKTLSLWFKLDSYLSGSRGLAAKGNGGSGPYGWYLYKNGPDNKIGFTYYDSAVNAATLVTNNAVDLNTWYHLCITTNGTTDRLYLNGVEEDSTSSIVGIDVNTPLVIGRFYSNFTDYNIDGQIDQVRFYESTLDATAVANLYNEKQAYITKNASNPFGDSNEVAFYKFENNSNDSTGSNNGTDTSITYTSGSGIIGTYSADFNGSSSYISVPHSSTFNWTNNKTLSVWVKFDAVASLRGIVAKGSGSAPYGWVLYMTSTSKIQFVQYNSLSQASTLASSFTAVTNKWYHVCVTGDGTTNKLYIDGSLNHSAVAVTATNGTDALVFGRLYSDTNNYYHSGEIDQLRFFDRTLDGDEVFKLYAEVIN
jgi:hypothetical protein